MIRTFTSYYLMLSCRLVILLKTPELLLKLSNIRNKDFLNRSLWFYIVLHNTLHHIVHYISACGRLSKVTCIAFILTVFRCLSVHAFPGNDQRNLQEHYM
jgi:hypothetical protein